MRKHHLWTGLSHLRSHRLAGYLTLKGSDDEKAAAARFTDLIAAIRSVHVTAARELAASKTQLREAEAVARWLGRLRDTSREAFCRPGSRQRLGDSLRTKATATSSA